MTGRNKNFCWTVVFREGFTPHMVDVEFHLGIGSQMGLFRHGRKGIPGRQWACAKAGGGRARGLVWIRVVRRLAWLGWSCSLEGRFWDQCWRPFHPLGGLWRVLRGSLGQRKPNILVCTPWMFPLAAPGSWDLTHRSPRLHGVGIYSQPQCWAKPKLFLFFGRLLETGREAVF